MKIRLFGRIIVIPNWIKVTLIIIILLTLGICGYFIQKSRNSGVVTPIEETTHIISSPESTAISITVEPEPTPKTICVYIVGEIMIRNVYELPEGSILKDLVSIAGGFTENADCEAINLAYKLKNGMMIRIPSIYDTDKKWLLDSGTATSGDSSDSGETTLVNINTATVDELCKLPGIGESTALKIISYRTENGPFQNITDIMKISGIKEARYNEIKNFITVG